MSKKSSFTTITSLPPRMTRRAAVAFLQDHRAMIDLNPLVVARRRMPAAPAHALAEELRCAWYLVTDRIAYLPGGLASGSVSYSCAFLDLPGVGMQTHCYAPMGVDLRTRWSVEGSSEDEDDGGCGDEARGRGRGRKRRREPVELGINAPATGLYLREDTELRCSVVMAAFVKRTLKDSHKRLVERLARRGERDLGPVGGEREAGGDGGARATDLSSSSSYREYYELRRERDDAGHHHHHHEAAAGNWPK